MMRKRRRAATRYQVPGCWLPRRAPSGKREVVGLGYQVIEVPAWKIGMAGDVPLAAGPEEDDVFLVGLGGKAQDVPRYQAITVDLVEGWCPRPDLLQGSLGAVCPLPGPEMHAGQKTRHTTLEIRIPAIVIIMTNTLLRSIRERILDESEPLDGLLRKCLLLGAETGSNALRDWARNELNGYSNNESIPEYRVLPTPPIVMSSMSGNYLSKGQHLHRLELPAKASEAIPDQFHITQPIGELEQLSTSKSVSFIAPELNLAKIIWNRTLDSDFQQILDLSYTIAGSTLAGVMSKVRTQLVEIIADLSSDIPLDELPKKAQVDSAVSQRIGTQYNTTIHATHGSTAIGNKAQATTNGITVEEAILLLDAARSVASDEVADDEDKDELLEVIERLRTVVSQSAPDTGHVVKEVGKLRKIAERIGGAALIAAVDGSASALMELAMSGAFG